ncbi:hypothetical protein GCM10027053_41590 [Intrasporangium mesophilum]
MTDVTPAEAPEPGAAELASPAAGPARARTVVRWVATVLAGLLVWFALVAPEGGRPLTPLAFLRVPVEGIVLIGLVLVLPRAPRRWLEVVVGVVLGLLVLVRILDLAFLAALYRRFNPVTDWRYAGSAKDLLGDSAGAGVAVLATAGIGLLVLALLVLTPLAMVRLGTVVDRHRAGAVRVAAALAAVWVAAAVLSLHLVPSSPLASSSAAALVADEVGTVRANLHDREVFARAIPVDRFHDAAGPDLLTALRGKDVVFVFVESYGKVAVDRSPDVAAALDAGNSALRGAGYGSASAWLTSPTFGGISWLAHSTFQSGLWVNSQQRYDQLLDAQRFTLSRAFARGGWRTVDVIPANRSDWPEGKAFYGYDQVYDSRTLGYAGEGWGYAPMPDQFTLAAFDRLELTPRDRPPVMAEIDLVSSHIPWAPLPRLVDWNAIGDGSIFWQQAGKATPREVVWQTPAGVRTAYGQSIAYSLRSVVSFLERTRDRNLVAVVLGDHQPVSIVSGDGASHDVPVSIISRDPSVLDRISSWGWASGVRPGPDAPVWPMDRFRDRFLTAFGSTSANAMAAPASSTQPTPVTEPSSPAARLPRQVVQRRDVTRRRGATRTMGTS